eukprot:TRINITY_DN14052_c0_g1_i1.p1 TRINITY_DN14052_c0_g1~~TRINITY_DN14052_c0_g1_i1.p1  ORF type:complete len:199 (+),score=42.13 TRINITY_DN14052_c0_g1_i1:52-648(+)
MFGDGDSKATKKLKSTIKFPAHFKQKVLMKNVKLPVIEKWLEKTIEKVQKMEDERLVGFLVNYLEDNDSPDPQMIQINLIPFVGEVNAAKVAFKLWKLLLSAQECGGIPEELQEKRRDIRERDRHADRESRQRDRYSDRRRDNSRERDAYNRRDDNRGSYHSRDRRDDGRSPRNYSDPKGRVVDDIRPPPRPRHRDRR